MNSLSSERLTSPDIWLPDCIAAARPEAHQLNFNVLRYASWLKRVIYATHGSHAALPSNSFDKRAVRLQLLRRGLADTTRTVVPLTLGNRKHHTSSICSIGPPEPTPKCLLCPSRSLQTSLSVSLTSFLVTAYPIYQSELYPSCLSRRMRPYRKATTLLVYEDEVKRSRGFRMVDTLFEDGLQRNNVHKGSNSDRSCLMVDVPS
ncbi:hypothetical protein FB567DRAFT_305337 [Paraphoma chrysanthemicola]|uniref:Uncharacterized protein n=1 Tax=Paraphoma chrysanthemicola TaxID=798071 RepID=A0A8K0RC90_9PLEO|nr:hypothetical protein FB567DRAFT_305337 [Paraphoma chrysanthemicola]